MQFERTIKPSITPFQLNPEDELKLTLRDGRLWEMKLVSARAEVVARGFDRYQDHGHACGDISVYAFEATVLINGREHVMRREVGSQASFYQPWTVDGVHIWFDAAACCYKDAGEDCYLGPYSGGSAHAGLDINMPKGTILTAPFDLGDHLLQRGLEAGFRNNSWVGVRRWPDQSTWVIGTAHVIEIIPPQYQPLKRGTPYATAAGVFVGFHEQMVAG